MDLEVVRVRRQVEGLVVGLRVRDRDLGIGN